MGFEFDGDTAEWFRWYLMLKEVTSKDLDLTTGVGGDEIYLTNWCAFSALASFSIYRVYGVHIYISLF